MSETGLPSQFGAAEEKGYSKVASHKRLTQEKSGTINWRNPYFNSGMLLPGPVHREIFNPTSELLRKCASDAEKMTISCQTILNYLFTYYKFEMNDLGYQI